MRIVSVPKSSAAKGVLPAEPCTTLWLYGHPRLTARPSPRPQDAKFSASLRLLLKIDTLTRRLCEPKVQASLKLRVGSEKLRNLHAKKPRRAKSAHLQSNCWSIEVLYADNRDKLHTKYQIYQALQYHETKTTPSEKSGNRPGRYPKNISNTKTTSCECTLHAPVLESAHDAFDFNALRGLADMKREDYREVEMCIWRKVTKGSQSVVDITKGMEEAKNEESADDSDVLSRVGSLALQCDGSCRAGMSEYDERKHRVVGQEDDMITLEHRMVIVNVVKDGKWNSLAYIHDNIRRSGLC
ncbi:hypothetical protein EV421DRAFT_2022254 [Armillaria borealis]|uniref:Uncharacterized protein n=1 Tax=Armillaria borealis TaxID=47425 RepID=A0AA39J5D3_9AGAR|nr:hypothetical protein EV421DRAFT_2022254 [Armillaria borealis]